MQDYRTKIVGELQTTMENVDLNQMDMFVRRILEAKTVFCDGLGRSGLAMRGFAMRLGQMGRKSALVGEATAPAFAEGDLLIICSASGSSPTLLYHAEKAKAYGGRVVLITGKTDSDLTHMADGMVLIQAPDKDAPGALKGSIQPMGALFEQTSQLVCDMAVLQLMEELQMTSEEMRRYHANLE